MAEFGVLFSSYFSSEINITGYVKKNPIRIFLLVNNHFSRIIKLKIKFFKPEKIFKLSVKYLSTISKHKNSFAFKTELQHPGLYNKQVNKLIKFLIIVG